MADPRQPSPAGWGENIEEPVAGALVSVLLCLLATHAWLVRRELPALAASLARSAGAALGGSPAPVTLTRLEARVRVALDKLRTERVTHLLQATSWFPTLALVMVLATSLRAGSPVMCGKALAVAVGVAQHAAFLYISFREPRGPLTVRSAERAFKMTFLALIPRILAFPDDLLHGSFRNIGRAAFGLAILDSSLSIKYNILFSVVSCFGCWRIGAGAPIVRSEILTCAALCSAFRFADYAEAARVRAAVERTASSRGLRAARRLLSVLCDAQVHVGAGSHIIGYSRPLLHLLAPGRGEQQAVLRGKCFLEYVLEPDRKRFLNFLSSSSRMAQADSGAGDACEEQDAWDDDGNGSAACIQVRLHGHLGVEIQVELFHVWLPDVDNSMGHLLGIREVGDCQREVVVEAPGVTAFSLQRSACSGAPQHRALSNPGTGRGGSPPMGAAASHVPNQARRSLADVGGRGLAAVPRPAGPEAPLCPRQVPPDLRSQSLPSSSSSERSSSSASSRSSSRARPRDADGVESVALRVYTDTSTLVIREITFCFEGPHAPAMGQWLSRRECSELRRRSQDFLNWCSHQAGEDEEDEDSEEGEDALLEVPDPRLGSLQLCCHSEPFLAAEHATLEPAPSDETPSASEGGGTSSRGEGAGRPQFLVCLRLRGLTGLRWLPWAAGGGRRRGRREAARPLEPMPPISEAASLPRADREVAKEEEDEEDAEDS